MTPWFQTLRARLGRLLVIRETLPLWQRAVLGALPVGLLLGGWFALTAGPAAEDRVISPTILPSPVEVVRSFHSLWFEAELTRSVVASALRVVLGFVVALAVTFPLGILAGAFSKVRASVEPLMVFGSYLPIPALVPLTLSLFGTGETQKIMFLALAFGVFLLPLFVKAIGEIDDIFIQTAQTMGAGKWQIVRHVLLGGAMARIFQSMRMGFGIGWTYIILAEMVAAERGLGQIIIIAQRRGPREHIYLVLVVIVLLAWLTDRLWARAGRALFPWQEDVQ